MQSKSKANPTPDLKRPGAENRGWVFYFDGDCRFCTNVVRVLASLDLFRRVNWVPYQSLAKPPVGLSWEELDSAAYLDTGASQLHEGFYAFRMLTLRVLPLLPLAPMFWMPGMTVVGVPVYRWVARNRHRFSSCLFPTRRYRK